MDTSRYMIITKGEICTDRVLSCEKSSDGWKYKVVFQNGKSYTYSVDNIIFMKDPERLNPQDYIVDSPDGKRLFDIRQIYQFANGWTLYWHLVFDHFERSYKKADLHVAENCLKGPKSANTFEYLKEISSLSEIPNDKGEILLQKRYQELGFVSTETALSLYLDNRTRPEKHSPAETIFPFGCNQSQYQAVRRALENQISVIQGPPGTGKTQTILNIIANLVVDGKTVLVVSNNNAATRNVLEKLADDRFGMEFLVAPLGSAANKADFVEKQTGLYPDLSSWVQPGSGRDRRREVSLLSEKLQGVYTLQEEIAGLKQRKQEIELEYRHFMEYASQGSSSGVSVKVRGRISSGRVMRIWQEAMSKLEASKKLSPWSKWKWILLYGIGDGEFYRQDPDCMISQFQRLYYETSLGELTEKLQEKEAELSQCEGNLEFRLEGHSLSHLKGVLANRYRWSAKRERFSERDLYQRSAAVLKEYPVVLSTTFSARSSLNMDAVLFDYVVIDEASQVDLATGALALSCAKNAVIVGDLKQLPNVISKETLARADQILTKYRLGEAYDFGHKSFLQSVVDALPQVPSTLLREHYRCHPKIITFCNRKFYNGELVVMTEDDGAEDALMAVKTVEGNHARGRYSQRQIDVIKSEILPGLDVPPEEIGVIAPYNAQVDAIKEQIPGIEAATVHKFQGREKDVIILSTVDDQIGDFTDDPYLLNVAVSRAKKKLIVVVSGNRQERNGNIVDLISYISYNRMEVIDSKVYSVFDYLYAQYHEKRRELLHGRAKISEYVSENLTYAMLMDILKDHREYGVVCRNPLSMVVRDLSALSEEERRYAQNPLTHLDFLIFSKLSKQPVLAVETDGYRYHKAGTVQHERDRKKDHILQVCGLPLVRISTNGSGEKEKILQAMGFM